MNALEISILKTVAYFDVFKHPVTKQEIGYFLDQKYDASVLNKVIEELVDSGIMFKLENYYALSNNLQLVEKRNYGNALAIKELKKACTTAAFLYRWFPFINGIGISGSLSKNVAYKNSDFDFFIITAANKLWIARTIFIIFYHAACLFGLRKMFCLNYMIDEQALQIDEKNIFTATEISTLLVCEGNDVYQKFFKANSWVDELMPNYIPRFTATNKAKPNVFKRLLENLFTNKFSDKINNSILHFYEQRWKKLALKNKFTPKGFMLGGMVITPHVCKPMPQHFQQKILNAFAERFENARQLMSEKLYFNKHRELRTTA